MGRPRRPGDGCVGMGVSTMTHGLAPCTRMVDEALTWPPRSPLLTAPLAIWSCVPARRFPPPWSVEETDACFVVRDHNGQGARLFLFRGGAGTAIGGASARPRFATRCTEHRTIPPQTVVINITLMRDGSRHRTTPSSRPSGPAKRRQPLNLMTPATRRSASLPTSQSCGSGTNWCRARVFCQFYANETGPRPALVQRPQNPARVDPIAPNGAYVWVLQSSIWAAYRLSMTVFYKYGIRARVSVFLEANTRHPGPTFQRAYPPKSRYRECVVRWEIFEGVF